MKIFLIILPFFLLFSATAQDAAEEKHPIDVALEKAIRKDYSTAGMVNAFGEASKKWDVELNKNYKLLVAGLNPDAKKALREAQRAWVTHRDKEIAYLGQFYSRMQGTMYRTIYAETTMTMVKDRALKLSDMVEMLKLRGKE